MKRNITVYSFVGILLVIAAFYDLQIDTFLYHPTSYFGWFMEHIYVMIPILILPFTMVMLVNQRPRMDSYALMVFACLYAGQQLDHYVTQTDLLWVMLINCVGIWLVLTIIISYIPKTVQARILPFMIFCCAVLIISSAIVGIMKTGWGRVRFRSTNGPDLFTPWYLPQGITGHKSFPSGHTTAASITLCLLAYPKYFDKKLTNYQYIIAFGSPIIMALSRMIMGAHYLSDTVAGFTVVYTVVITILYFTKKVNETPKQ